DGEVPGGVVHDRRGRPELRLGRVEGRRDGIRVAHVGSHGDAAAHRGNGLLERLAPATEHRHGGAEPRELERYRASEPGPAAGDERDPTLEGTCLEHHRIGPLYAVS